MVRISNKQLEERFDAGEDVLRYKKEGSERVFRTEIKKVNVDFPQWMIDALDVEAKRLGITRQALIKTMIDNELKKRIVA
jgi:hypothetical protein